MFHRRLHSQPVRMWLNREAGTEHTFRHVTNDPRSGRIDRIRTNVDMANGPNLSAKRDIVIYYGRTRYPRLGNDQTIRANLTVMTDMHEIIDLRALPNDRSPHSSAINAVMSTDLNIILQDNISDLWYLRMHTILRREAEAIRADNRRAVNYAALANMTVLPYGRIRVNDRIRPNFCILANIGMRIQYDIALDYRMIIHYCKRHDDNIFTECHILTNMRLVADTV